MASVTATNDASVTATNDAAKKKLAASIPVNMPWKHGMPTYSERLFIQAQLMSPPPYLASYGEKTKGYVCICVLLMGSYNLLTNF